MTPGSLQVVITVTAGAIPGHPQRNLSRRWDWIPSEPVHPSPEDMEQLHKKSDEAHAYARSLEHPGFVKWVKVEWLWL